MLKVLFSIVTILAVLITMWQQSPAPHQDVSANSRAVSYHQPKSHRDRIYASCRHDHVCESIVDVHFSKCYVPTFGNVSKHDIPTANQRFSKCINEASGYKLLTTSPTGDLLSLEISH